MIDPAERKVLERARTVLGDLDGEAMLSRVSIRGKPFGNLYLTEERDDEPFSAEDEARVPLLANALDATVQIARALAGQTGCRRRCPSGRRGDRQTDRDRELRRRPGPAVTALPAPSPPNRSAGGGRANSTMERCRILPP